MSKLLDKIHSRGHWRVVIRPATFSEKLVANISELFPILQRTTVQLRGWDFPHMDLRTPPHTDLDWIGQESEWEQHLEVWRFYQSGQFVDFSGMKEDWMSESILSTRSEKMKPGSFLSVVGVVFRFTEIFELASRLAMTEAGDDQIRLDIAVKSIKGRALWMDPSRVGFPLEHKSEIGEVPYQVDISRVELVTETRELALKPAIELFQRFGWNPSLATLRDMQEQLVRKGSMIIG